METRVVGRSPQRPTDNCPLTPPTFTYRHDDDRAVATARFAVRAIKELGQRNAAKLRKYELRSEHNAADSGQT
ncbi:hypothetical protein KGM_206390 [Danaus plexippus plexippus]|uniref:Uncharacterized protein n=1 Tax=Danaus plexippus plexippus TaxID=278856 RepID=A0A212EJ43_DANPL|nr:hypothetical protein KGM_206390 [Danaus plexippus plexippus]